MQPPHGLDTARPDAAEHAGRLALPPVSHLLYLHGFRSSPRSTKAMQMQGWLAERHPQVHFDCPQLPPSPADALALLQQRIAHWPRPGMAIVGSSLGGFYATVLGEQLGCRCVLINPAVAPARDLADRIGTTTMWHSDDAFHFGAEHVEQLRRMTPAALTNQPRTLVIIAKGDEVLDWREMAARHAGSQLVVLEGGDHALSDFAQHLPRIERFCGWRAA